MALPLDINLQVLQYLSRQDRENFINGIRQEIPIADEEYLWKIHGKMTVREVRAEWDAELRVYMEHYAFFHEDHNIYNIELESSFLFAQLRCGINRTILDCNASYPEYEPVEYINADGDEQMLDIVNRNHFAYWKSVRDGFKNCRQRR